MELWDWVGISLVVLGLCLYLIDIDFDADFMSGFDPVGIVAGLCIVAGVILTTNSVALSILVFLVTLFVGILRWSVRRRGAKSVVPYETVSGGLIGQAGFTKTDLNPRGLVQLKSELWSATSDSGEHIAKDERVSVLDVDGNTLLVFREN